MKLGSSAAKVDAPITAMTSKSRFKQARITNSVQVVHDGEEALLPEALQDFIARRKNTAGLQ